LDENGIPFINALKNFELNKLTKKFINEKNKSKALPKRILYKIYTPALILKNVKSTIYSLPNS